VEPLFEGGGHRNLMFDEMCTGEMVQANQHVIVHDKEAMILDPGGHKVFSRLFAEMSGAISPASLRYVFLSHQDPDIVAAINGWLMASDATALAPSLWMRFIPHFGVDEYAVKRMTSIPDEGLQVRLGSCTLEIIPAHFLHSPGNYQIYDPASRILYSGDFGASIGHGYRYVEDFDAHVAYMSGFHRRYMTSNRAIRRWLDRIRDLDIQTVAPQHGAIFRGRPLVERFFAWARDLRCGVDLYD
jgi:flavorubredoxin